VSGTMGGPYVPSEARNLRCAREPSCSTRRELAAGAEANGWEPERGVDPCPHSRREGRVEQGLDVLPAPCPGQAGDRREPAEEGRAGGRGQVREMAEGARHPGGEYPRPGVEAAHRLEDTELELEAVIWAGAVTTYCPSKSDQSSLSRRPSAAIRSHSLVPGAGVSTISWKISMRAGGRNRRSP